VQRMRLSICCLRGQSMEARVRVSHTCGFTPFGSLFEAGECHVDEKLELTGGAMGTGARVHSKARFRLGRLSNYVIGAMVNLKTAPFAWNEWSLETHCGRRTSQMTLKGSYLPSRTLYIDGRATLIFSMATQPDAIKKQAEFIASPGGLDAPGGELATMEIPSW